ncbi:MULTISPECIES: long-chain-fatty-acid--CoA ligase [unclassified Sphingomonas]|uniref:long-chain-fatty-acid--CoA ligase n=1 Tax=unclassified Sphingomonas TaxID=196159 RepID=UPI000928F730|nr:MULTISPECIES: long-chain-fatty-acid--CoA ligase [unclassified Sphingomonas]MBN8848325.1 long-chain-fatty-acid--CoA ligase [Sphingomonas sp.]OJV31441.1 MAG: acyl-CoA synthetase [Sphingomonas sp. 67-36]
MIDLEAIQCLSDIPAAQAKVRGDETALLFEGQTITFAALEAQTAAVARALTADGAKPGQRIAVLTKNHPRWFPLFFGAGRARACPMPVNWRLSVPEIAFILSDGAPTHLFVGEDFFDGALEAVAGMERRPHLIALYGEHPGFVPFEAWLARGEGHEPAGRPELDDDVLQLYTSGTTGRPKGVVLTNRNYRRFMEMAEQVDGFAYEAGRTMMIVMPLFHVAGTNLGFSGLAQGCRTVLVKDFVPADAIATMVEEKVSYAFLAPAIIQMLLQSPRIAGVSFPELRNISYGASPISEDTLAKAQAVFGCDFIQFYGMTESAGSGSYLSPEAHRAGGLLKSCGKPWPGVEMAIIGADGEPLPSGGIGEIVIRGDIVMKGYWNRDEATAETLAGGWLHTGDAGYMDADGYFFVHDRIKDMIVSGGENVYPAEVENAIAGCPGVADVAVIGVPDDKWGEAVKALIVPEGEGATAEAVIAWARSRIAAYKAPKSVDFVEALPRNPSGKVLRRELRAHYWAGRDRAVG